MPTGTPDISALFARIPVGWSVRENEGRRYGVTRTVSAGGRIEKIFAEELGGTDVISANLYLGGRFRPCEMPTEKVLAFLRHSTPYHRRDTPPRRGASAALRGARVQPPVVADR